MRDIRNCDSIKKAIDEKSILIEDLVKSNLAVFADLEVEEKERLRIQQQLKAANENLLKATKRKKNGWLYGGLGFLAGTLFVNAIAN